MPRIRCLYMDCNFLDDNFCSAPKVEIDPDIGCSTYAPIGEGELLDDEWDEDEDNYDEWNTEDISKDFDNDEDDW